MIRTASFVAAAALTVGILSPATAGTSVVSAHLTPTVAAPPAMVAPAAARVKGRQVRIKVKGQRYGKKATITLKGYRGKAKGVKKTVRVKKTKTVKRLKPGKYKVIAKRITSNGAVAKAKRIKPKRVRVTKRRGATTRITYRQVKAPTTPPPNGAISRVSTDKNGTQGNNHSVSMAFSPDGSKVVFDSMASNLVPVDTNQDIDVFVKVLATGAITRVSTAADDSQSNGWSSGPMFSPDGTKVAFTSKASNLVPGDTNYNVDVFVKVLASGAITRVSTAANGAQPNGSSTDPVFSPDGTKIAFSSQASNLVSGDTNRFPDVFVKVLATGAITRVSTAANGAQGITPADPDEDNSLGASDPAFSPDGAKMVFSSWASNLVPGDTNDSKDVFVKVLATGAITRASTTANGVQSNSNSSEPVFSPDGAKIAFSTYATNLIPGNVQRSRDVLVKVLATGAITRVSADKNGTRGNDYSAEPMHPAFSSDSSRIMFSSEASNLVPGDTNDSKDVFVKVLATGAITRVSTSANGSQGNRKSDHAVFSPDRDVIALSSEASNLVPGDTNARSDIFLKQQS